MTKGLIFEDYRKVCYQNVIKTRQRLSADSDNSIILFSMYVSEDFPHEEQKIVLHGEQVHAGSVNV